MPKSPVNPPSHADEAWKTILDVYFREFLSFFYMDIAQQIDWEAGFEVLDKELQALTTESMIGRRLVDKLIKVRSKEGQEGFVLLHTEIQGESEPDFAERLYTYNYRLRDRYQLPILTLAILVDDRPKWRPACYQETVWCHNVLTFQFSTCKLLDFEGEELTLLEMANPFGTIVVASLAALKTRLHHEC